jgi:hypothetical protein
MVRLRPLGTVASKELGAMRASGVEPQAEGMCRHLIDRIRPWHRQVGVWKMDSFFQ